MTAGGAARTDDEQQDHLHICRAACGDDEGPEEDVRAGEGVEPALGPVDGVIEPHRVRVQRARRVRAVRAEVAEDIVHLRQH